MLDDDRMPHAPSRMALLHIWVRTAAAPLLMIAASLAGACQPTIPTATPATTTPPVTVASGSPSATASSLGETASPVAVVATPRPCPADRGAGSFRPPAVVLDQGGDVLGRGFDTNMSYEGCASGMVQSEWIAGAADSSPFARGAPLTVQAANGAMLLRVDSATYWPARPGNTSSSDLGATPRQPLLTRPGPSPGRFIVNALPLGRWSVLVSVIVSDGEWDVTWRGSYYFIVSIG